MDNTKSSFIETTPGTHLNKDNVVQINFRQYNDNKCGLTLWTNYGVHPSLHGHHYLSGPCDEILKLRDQFIKK